MKLFAVALVLACGCDVYGPALLVSNEGGDAAAEACASTCGGACVDLQTDPNNCGACGATCETGCSGGSCTPTLLAGGLSAPHGLLVAGSELYVANHGSITVQSMSKIDGTGLKIFATSQLFPDRLAANATSLFWTADANVSSDPGGSIDFEAFSQSFCAPPNYTYCYDASNLPSPYGIAVEGDTIFVTTLDATNNGPAGCAGKWTSSVLACPVTGCAVTSCATSGGPTVVATGTQLAGVTADAKNVYWADSGAHAVRSCPLAGCGGAPPTDVARIAGAPFDVVSDGTNVYFTDRSGGNLFACPTAGCGQSPTLLASGLDDPVLLAVDSKAVYVSMYAGGAPGKGGIARCDLPSCAGGAVKIAANLKAPYGIAIDSTYVYWAEEGSQGVSSTDGSVSKLLR